MLDANAPLGKILFWSELLNAGEVNWEKIHISNFKSTIITRIRSFYFKLFHKSIGLNDFLHKIKRKDSPNCSLCNKEPETYSHLFIECPVVSSIWDELIKIIYNKTKSPKLLCVSSFQKMFGYIDDKYVTYLFLLLKYFIYVCKFQNKPPNFDGYRLFIASNKKTEYCIAKKNNKLPAHFKKWRFDL